MRAWRDDGFEQDFAKMRAAYLASHPDAIEQLAAAVAAAHARPRVDALAMIADGQRKLNAIAEDQASKGFHPDGTRVTADEKRLAWARYRQLQHAYHQRLAAEDGAPGALVLNSAQPDGPTPWERRLFGLD